MLSDVDVLTLLLKLTEVLVETEVLLKLLLADSDALIEADTLLLKLVLTDAESLADAFATLAEAD